EVRRAAEEPGDVLGQHVEDLARRVAPGDALGIGGESRPGLVPPPPPPAPLPGAGLPPGARGRRPPRGAHPGPPRPGPRAAARAPPGGEVLLHAVGDEELRVLGPIVVALRETHLFLAERLAVRLRRALLVRRAVADVAVDDDHRGPADGLAEHAQRVLDAL